MTKHTMTVTPAEFPITLTDIAKSLGVSRTYASFRGPIARPGRYEAEVNGRPITLDVVLTTLLCENCEGTALGRTCYRLRNLGYLATLYKMVVRVIECGGFMERE